MVITGEVLDISNHLNRKGYLRWKVPEGDWKMVRYICANTGQAHDFQFTQFHRAHD